MFTGLIEVLGTVRSGPRSTRGARLEVAVCWPDGEPPAGGDSVAVDGACLTATASSATGFAADLSPETLRRTTLGEVRPGEPVNLERALRLGGRLGGHLVQGHVDGVVRLLETRPESGFARWRLSLPEELAPQVAEKGSVAVHGVSLTVTRVGGGWFEVALIPATLAHTTLGRARVGSRLHLETDVLAKYVARAFRSVGPSALELEFGGEQGRA